MKETVEEFLKRGGSIQKIAEGVVSEMPFHFSGKGKKDTTTDDSMRRAENETDCRKTYYEN
jgi:hypothetical protein